MQTIKTSLQPKFSAMSSASSPQTASAAAEGFQKYADQLSADHNPYANIDVKDIKTKMVKIEKLDEHGNVSHEIKEMAVCPECGETNCACLAQVTCQSRLDEENAKGVRNAEQAPAMSIVPQSFNQLSMNLDQKSSSSSSFR